MPDVSSLYPQPPKQQPGLLSGNPLDAINALRGVQAVQILGQQAGALGQQPAATLRGTNLSNAIQQVQLQDAVRRTVYGAIGNALFGKNYTDDDVHSAVANVSRAYPQLAQQYPGVFSAAGDVALNDKKNGAGTLVNMGLSSGEASSRVAGPPGPEGQPQQMPLAAANVSGTFPTGLPPGSAESAGVMQSDLARARNFAQDIFPWQQALEKGKALQASGQTLGPGSKGRQELESTILTASPTLARLVGIDPQKVANYAEFEKYTTQAIQARANSLGPHTNEGVATSAAGTPNVNITDLAGLPLLKATIGVSRIDQALTLEASKSGAPNYTATRAQLAKNIDPRAFMIDMMEPDQIAKLQKTLKGADRQQFNRSLKLAIDNGVIRPLGQ